MRTIYAALTMRSDFLRDCAQFPGLAEAINTGSYLIPRLRAINGARPLKVRFVWAEAALPRAWCNGCSTTWATIPINRPSSNTP